MNRGPPPPLKHHVQLKRRSIVVTAGNVIADAATLDNVSSPRYRGCEVIDKSPKTHLDDGSFI